MNVLGLNGGEKREEDFDLMRTYQHDAAAALICDGHLVAAIEEERLNRIKHTNSFPAHSIRYCLEAANLNLNDIDRIVINTGFDFKETESLNMCLIDARRPVRSNPVSDIAYLFERDFGMDVGSKIRFCHHHLAHGWSAYALSGFSDSLVVTIDGWGDDCCGMAFRGHRNDLETIRQYSQSLGIMYSAIIRLLGFSDFDEYKAMGLAPYGNTSTFQSLFRKGYQLLPDGMYHIAGMGEWLALFREARLLNQLRRETETFTQVHMDIAAALQTALEEIVQHMLKSLASETEVRSLCLSGGVAHNCTLNGRILESGMFDRVFVQPAASDAGGAIGAAYSTVFREDPSARIVEMPHVFLGRHIGTDAQIRGVLEQWSDVICFEAMYDAIEITARLLAEGNIIGWVNGRSEFGPRALGNRSILADPRPIENKDRINKIVKKRESFRPFAPSIIEERMSEFFEVPATGAPLSFMTFTIRVREAMRGRLGAVTHVDGTARVQSVSSAYNKEFWQLLNAFGNITGVPVLLNTSFNTNSEPIVDSLEDALTCFLTTGLDYLVTGKYLVRRRDPEGAAGGIKNFAPSLPPYCRLEKFYKFQNAASGVRTAFAIVPVKQSAFCVIGPGEYGSKEREITEAAFNALTKADGNRSIAELLDSESCCPKDVRVQLVGEISKLWSERLVNLCPVGCLKH